MFFLCPLDFCVTETTSVRSNMSKEDRTEQLRSWCWVNGRRSSHQSGPRNREWNQKWAKIMHSQGASPSEQLLLKPHFLVVPWILRMELPAKDHASKSWIWDGHFIFKPNILQPVFISYLLVTKPKHCALVRYITKGNIPFLSKWSVVSHQTCPSQTCSGANLESLVKLLCATFLRCRNHYLFSLCLIDMLCMSSITNIIIKPLDTLPASIGSHHCDSSEKILSSECIYIY